MSLRITAFGTVAATRDGAPLDLGGPQQRAVLGLLVASAGRVVSTDRFLEDLWDGEPPPKALGGLQSYVSRLRTVLEPERRARAAASVLVSSSPGYVLSLETSQVDVWAFSALARSAVAATDPAAALAAADEALALWTDEPFGGHTDQEWAALEVTRLRELRADVVEARAAAALALGRSGEVATDLADHVRQHPMREQGARLLATAFYRLGRQGDALGLLAAVRERLVDELGIDPSPELAQLELDILHHDPGLRGPVVATPAAAEPDPRPQEAAGAGRLIGRDAELARLHAAADRAAGPAVVWVGGEAGIGKSALVERFCDESVARWTVARGHCPEVDGAPPGWAWAEVVGALRGGDPDPRAIRGVTPFELAHDVHAVVSGTGHPVLVVLDDVHRADGETLQVLRHLLTSLTGPALVVATYRPDEVGPDLGTTMAATAGATVDRLDLAGLDADSSLVLLREHCETELPDGAWTALVERASGNPLFLRQVGRLAASEGAAIATSELPSAIRDVIGRRLARLPAATVDVLSRAAVLGRQIEFDLLLACEAERGLSSEDELVDALDAGIVAGLVQADTPDSLSFAHALVRDVLYDRLPPMRRHRLHATAWTVLEREVPDRIGTLAFHAAASLDGRSAHRAAPLLVEATRHALAAGSTTEALRYVEAALHAQDLASIPEADRLEARRLLVGARASTGDLAGAHDARRISVETAERFGDRREVMLALRWQTATAWTIRELGLVDEDRVARLQVAIRELGEPGGLRDEPLLVELLATLAFELETSDRAELAFDAATEACARARAIGDDRLLCLALNAAYLTSYPPRPDGLLRQVAEELLDASRRARLLSFEAVAHCALFGAYAGARDLARADEHVALAVTSGSSSQLPLLIAVSRIFDGLKLLMRGELDAAAAAYDRTTAQMVAAGDPNGAPMGTILRFTVDHARGDTSGTLDELLIIDSFAPGFVSPLIVTALLDAGREEEARDWWRPGTEPKRDYFWLYNACLRGENAARLGDADVMAWARAELAPWSGHFGGLVSGAATLGPVDRVLGMLAEAAGDEDEAAACFARAAALATRTGATQWTERPAAGR